MEIKTERLLIREFKVSDWEAVHEYASKGEILQYEPWGPNTVNDTKDFVSKAMINAQLTRRNSFEFAIELIKSGKLIGGCGVISKYQKTDEINVGFIINPKYWNRGFATEAAEAMISFAKKLPNINTISAVCDEFNTGSQRVLEKCGFVKLHELNRDVKFKGRKSKTFVYQFLF